MTPLEEIYEFYTKGNFKGRAERVKSLIEDAFYGVSKKISLRRKK